MEIDLDFKIPLWKHQKEAAIRAGRAVNFGFFFEVGAGKTAAAITALRMKYDHHQFVMNTLIFGPPVILKNWENELKMHLPEHLHPYIHILYGPGVKRQGDLVRIIYEWKEKRTPAIIITNYQSMLMPKVCELLAEWGPEIMVFDELHRLKSSSTKTFKNMVKLADKATYKFGLTGTLITNDAMDIWAQYRILDGGKTFGKNFFSFRSQYFYDKNAGMPKDRYFPDWRVRNGALEQFNAKVNETGMVVKKLDCLDLPPLVKEIVPVDMSPEQRRAYKAMQETLIADFGDQFAIAEFALTKSLRLQQIVSGHVTLDDGSVKVFKDNPRKQALEELLEDLTPQSKVLVWCVFKQNYEDVREVCKRLDIKWVEIHGESKDRFDAVDKINNDPEYRVLIGHPGSGGIGINLVPSNVSIFYSRNFSLEQDVQAEARNHRGGSEIHERVTRIDLVAPGTIDEEVVRSLHAKQAISDKILKDLICESGNRRKV